VTVYTLRKQYTNWWTNENVINTISKTILDFFYHNFDEWRPISKEFLCIPYIMKIPSHPKLFLAYLVNHENYNCCRLQWHLCMLDLRIHLARFMVHIWILMTIRSEKNNAAEIRRVFWCQRSELVTDWGVAWAAQTVIYETLSEWQWQKRLRASVCTTDLCF